MNKKAMHSHYIKAIAFFASGILFLFVLINFLVDPYGIYGFVNIKGFNSNKPSIQSHLRMAKAYQIKHQKPRAIILGTSRAEFGLDPDHPGFSHRPTYNLNLSGGNIYEMLRYFQHTDNVSSIDQVVLAMDFFQFDINSENSIDFYEERLATDARGVVMDNWFPIRDLFDSLLTLDALIASLNTIASQFRRPVYLENGLIDPTETVRGKLIHVIGQRELFKMSEKRYFNKTYDGFALESNNGFSSSLENYRMLVSLAYAKDIDLKLVINPSHARQFETLAIKGLWPTFEKWKTQLVKINENEAEIAGKLPFLLWDFSGYSIYTTEPVPKVGELNAKMIWYWESSHFTKELGDLVLDKVLGTGSIKTSGGYSFGAILTGKNIDAYLRNVRKQREVWRNAHPSDVKEIMILLN
jgi:hypothetical protein